jgi:hypothetical protein
MKKVMIATLLFVSVTALPAIAANDNSGVNETLNEEQVQQQQDMKRKEMLDDMQVQAQKRKQQLQQQSAEIKGQQNRIGQKNNNSSVKN